MTKTGDFVMKIW